MFLVLPDENSKVFQVSQPQCICLFAVHNSDQSTLTNTLSIFQVEQNRQRPETSRPSRRRHGQREQNDQRGGKRAGSRSRAWKHVPGIRGQIRE